MLVEASEPLVGYQVVLSISKDFKNLSGGDYHEALKHNYIETLCKVHITFSIKMVSKD